MKQRVALVLLSLCFALAGPRVSHASEPKQVEALRALQADLAKVQRVHLRVSSRILLLLPNDPSSPETAGRGSIEYWAEGKKFRVNSRSDASLPFLQDTDVAFDGKSFQILDHNMKLLSLRTGDLPEIPSSLPNPFFFAVDFLSRRGDACPGCSLRLEDLRDSTLWAARLASARVSAAPGVGGIPALDLDGEPEGGGPKKYRVHLGTTEHGVLPVRIDSLDKEGRIAGMTELSSYREVKAGSDTFHIPDKVTFVAWDLAANQASLRAHFQIEELSINQGLDAAAFEISRNLATRVFDEDAKAYIKQPRP